jgi:RNA polymerase sigma factor (sigma-70 family)
MADGKADDATLVRRASEGDHDSISALLGRYGGPIRNRLGGKIGAHWKGALDEDDVMQVTYLEAFVRIGRFSPRADHPGGPGAAFQAWLGQIADNNLRDAIRGLERAKRPDPRKRVQTAPAQDSYVSLVEMLGVTTTTPSRHAARGEATRAVKEALKQMPGDYRKVIDLYDLKGKPIEAVAQELGRTPGAVYMLRARAHDRMKELLGGASRFFSET